MFLQTPIVATHIQDIALIINTILLIILIIIAELGFAEAPPEKRLYLRYLYPIIVVLVGLLVFAAYRQGGAA